MPKNQMSKYTSIILLLIVSVPFIGLGCMEERTETPTKGYVKVLVSEEVLPLLQVEELKFEELYPRARVDIEATSSREAIARLFNDSITVIVSTRSLNLEERTVAEQFKLSLGEYKIAIDGIAVIVNNENPITKLRTTQIDSIMSGRIKKWGTLGWDRSDAAIEIFLPSRNSGTFDIITAKVLYGGEISSSVKVPASSMEMIQSVAQNVHSIGMVGLNWLVQNKDKVKVLELSDPNAPDSLKIEGQYFEPHQAHLYRKFYPLTRDVYIYSRADRYGVGAGFISFITSAPGQIIVQNSGLVPATMPVRLVQLTSRGQNSE